MFKQPALASELAITDIVLIMVTTITILQYIPVISAQFCSIVITINRITAITIIHIIEGIVMETTTITPDTTMVITDHMLTTKIMVMVHDIINGYSNHNTLRVISHKKHRS